MEIKCFIELITFEKTLKESFWFCIDGHNIHFSQNMFPLKVHVNNKRGQIIFSWHRYE